LARASHRPARPRRTAEDEQQAPQRVDAQDERAVLRPPARAVRDALRQHDDERDERERDRGEPDRPLAAADHRGTSREEEHADADERGVPPRAAVHATARRSRIRTASIRFSRTDSTRIE